MKPREVFGERRKETDNFDWTAYDRIKDKDCIFLIWGSNHKTVLVFYDINGEERYACYYGTKHTIKNYSVTLGFIPAIDAWKYRKGDKNWKPIIIDRKAYRRFDEYLVAEAI